METEVAQIVAMIIIAITLHIESVDSLQCWQCIADNCDTNPAENYKATRKECLPGGFCQKVIYTDRFNNTTNPVSIVRSCSSRCLDKDNSNNCTLSKRGCVTRHCCQDTDFCNGGPQAQLPWELELLTCLVTLSYTLTFIKIESLG